MTAKPLEGQVLPSWLCTSLVPRGSHTASRRVHHSSQTGTHHLRSRPCGGRQALVALFTASKSPLPHFSHHHALQAAVRLFLAKKNGHPPSTMAMALPALSSAPGLAPSPLEAALGEAAGPSPSTLGCQAARGRLRCSRDSYATRTQPAPRPQKHKFSSKREKKSCDKEENQASSCRKGPHTPQGPRAEPAQRGRGEPGPSCAPRGGFLRPAPAPARVSSPTDEIYGFPRSHRAGGEAAEGRTGAEPAVNAGTRAKQSGSGAGTPRGRAPPPP